MLDAIQELRNAGAEAFQVGGVRIGVDSAFTGSGGAIALDGSTLTAPYTISAIGDPPTLAAALAIPGGVFDTVRRAGGTMDVAQSDSVTIDALRPPGRRFTLAQRSERPPSTAAVDRKASHRDSRGSAVQLGPRVDSRPGR